MLHQVLFMEKISIIHGRKDIKLNLLVFTQKQKNLMKKLQIFILKNIKYKLLDLGFLLFLVNGADQICFCLNYLNQF
tara:strand:+ start:297 stop:527 length:231 start_codon:yes stop_codon:yes gene_type:complete